MPTRLIAPCMFWCETEIKKKITIFWHLFYLPLFIFLLFQVTNIFLFKLPVSKNNRFGSKFKIINLIQYTCLKNFQPVNFFKSGTTFTFFHTILNFPPLSIHLPWPKRIIIKTGHMVTKYLSFLVEYAWKGYIPWPNHRFRGIFCNRAYFVGTPPEPSFFPTIRNPTYQ